VADDTSPWVEIDLSGLASGSIPVPFRMVAKRFNSSSQDSEDFIHDPLSVYQNVDLEALDEVDSSWRVATFVVNHEKTLSATHTYAFGATYPGGSGIIGTMIIKRPPPSS
jgi:hypothetical protein